MLGIDIQNPLLQSAHRRQALAWLAAGALAPALTACAPPEWPMRIGSTVFPGYEFMYLAREMGLLVETRVRMIELLSNVDALRALAVGQLEGAALTLDEMVAARADGVDLRAVLIFDISDGANAAMAHPPVTLATLAGKRIGVEDSASGAVMLQALLNAANVGPHSVQIVPVRLDRTEEVYRLGAVDVVVTAEPWASRLQRTGAARLLDSSAIPGRIVNVLAVRAPVLQTHASALRYLITGHFAAQAFMQSNPQKAAAWMAPRLQLPASELASVFQGLKFPDAAHNAQYLQSGAMLDIRAPNPRNVPLAQPLLPNRADWSALVDTRFLPL